MRSSASCTAHHPGDPGRAARNRQDLGGPGADRSRAGRHCPAMGRAEQTGHEAPIRQHCLFNPGQPFIPGSPPRRTLNQPNCFGRQEPMNVGKGLGELFRVVVVLVSLVPVEQPGKPPRFGLECSYSARPRPSSLDKNQTASGGDPMPSVESRTWVRQRPDHVTLHNSVVDPACRGSAASPCASSTSSPSCLAFAPSTVNMSAEKSRAVT